MRETDPAFKGDVIMKTDHTEDFIRKAVTGLGILILASPLVAFPPAPAHTIKGAVRDQFGNPLTGEGATAILEAVSGATLTTPVQFGLQPGVNYRFEVPMDAGLTPDSYNRNALNPQAPFTLMVVIGATVYLPIEMMGNLESLGEPGGLTVINLTLGVDADGDGIPDAWEEVLIQSGVYGPSATIEDVGADDDSDGDGLSNFAEYIAGTYAFDPTDVFSLEIADVNEERYLLMFLAIRGRSYNIESSLLQDSNWETTEFTVDDGSSEPQALDSYAASSVEIVRVRIERKLGEDSRFFRLVVR